MFIYLFLADSIMSFLDKLKLRKHEESLAPIGGGPPTLEPLFPETKHDDLFSGVPPAPQNFGSSASPFSGMVSPMPQSMNPMNSSMNPQFPNQLSSKDVEMLNSKLDAIKSMLENIGLRLEKLEKKDEKPKAEWRY